MNSDFQFELSKTSFDELRHLVYLHTGITLSEVKQEMVRRRFSPRLRKLGLESFEQYCELINSGDNNELSEFINAITTNLTSFFREKHHFDYLKNEFIPELIKRRENSLRIWSSACSTGEEPYSIMMSLYEACSEINTWNVKILATDIDSNILARAESGIYRSDKVEGLESDRLHRFFLRGGGRNTGAYKVKDEYRRMLHFKRLNLLKPWPMKQSFDVIFCRNVLIYFDKETQKILTDKFHKVLKPGGVLFLGHSETMTSDAGMYELMGKTVYRRLP